MPSSDHFPMNIESPRSAWTDHLLRMVDRPLSALVEDRLRASMPLECRPGHEERGAFAHLEAAARILAGIAPWLELDVPPTSEVENQSRLRSLTLLALGRLLDPKASDFCDFGSHPQCLVEAAFLSLALIRAPRRLAGALDERTRGRLVDALRASRGHLPSASNWLLFSALVECALFRLAGEADLMRIDYALRQHEQWYVGDGVYGDGPHFRWDYYNSFVIQPALLDVHEAMQGRNEHWDALAKRVRARADRYAIVQERLVAPDGGFPPLGRSIAYRCGAFHHLARQAWREELPPELPPGQARCALGAVIARTLGAPRTYDEHGWLRVGLAGSQPGLAETYITTGSVYLAAFAFLPLGLPESAAFWREADRAWTSARVWAGEDVPADMALWD